MGLNKYLAKNAPINPKTTRINGQIEPMSALPVPGSMYADAEATQAKNKNNISPLFIDGKNQMVFIYFPGQLTNNGIFPLNF